MAATAKAVFEADSGKLDAALLKVQSSMLRLQRGVAGAVAVFKGLQIAGQMVGSQFESVKKAFDLGGELNDMSANTGIAVKDLAILRQEFANAGKSAGDVAPAISKMQRSLAQGTGADLIERLGINMEELKSKTPTDQFHTLGDAISGLQNPLDRVKVATTLFGRAGTDLLSVFASKGFGQAAGELGGQVELLDKNAALFDDVSDKLNLTGIKLQGFFVGVADKVAPVLKPLLDRMATVDFSQWGQQIGDVVAFLIQTISDGSIVTILYESMKVALATAGNYALGILTGLGRAILQTLYEAIKPAITLLSTVTQTDFWAGVGNALIAAAKSFSAFLMDGIAMMIGALRGVPLIGDKVGNAADAVSRKAIELREGAAGYAGAASDKLSPVLNSAMSGILPSFDAIADAAKNGFEQGSNIFDTSDAKLNDAIGSAMDKVKAVSDKSRADMPPTQVNAVGEQVLDGAGKDKFSRLQRIGGGGGAGVVDPARAEQKRTNSILGDVRSVLRDMRTKMNSAPTGGVAVFG